MADESPNGSLQLAVGELKGAVTGLATMLADQNKTSSDFRKEMMDVFKGMRADYKEQAALLTQHIREDNEIKSIVAEHAAWKRDAEAKVEQMWDRNNSQRGFIAAIGLIGSMIGGGIVAGVEYFRGH
jgi:hypothetical protein